MLNGGVAYISNVGAFSVARFDELGNARAFDCETGDRNRLHVSFFVKKLWHYGLLLGDLRLNKKFISMMLQSYKIVLVLFFSVLSVTMSAQKRKVFIDSFTHDPMDLAAKSSPQYDGSGNPYALIKVRSNLKEGSAKDFTYKFGYIASKIGGVHGDELWIYVQKNARKITIEGEGFVPIKDADLGMTIEAGETYIMCLSWTLKQEKYQMLQFNVLPKEVTATVMFRDVHTSDEVLFGTTKNGSVAKNLKYGTYSYRVMAEDYLSAEGVVRLNDERTTMIEAVTLQPNFAPVTLSVDGDAKIYIHNQYKGTHIWTGNLGVGECQVETRQENHTPSVQRINVKRGQVDTIHLIPPTPITGSIAVVTEPLGATILIDGKEYGQTPAILHDIIIGRHEITLNYQNYKEERQQITVEEGKITDLNIQLKDVAVMTIASHPAGATVYIDGKEVGKTPYSEEMPSGVYDIKIEKDKYRTFNDTVHLSSSNPKQSFSLERWYMEENAFYVQPTFQVGSLMSAGAAVGGYIYNVNIEGTYMTGIDESEMIYWNEVNLKEEPCGYTYKASAFGCRVGYGIILGRKMRLTPQVGFNIVNVSASERYNESQTFDASKAYAVNAGIGVKFDYVLKAPLAAFIAPEYSFALKKSEYFAEMENISSKIKGFASGPNVRIGLSLFF